MFDIMHKSKHPFYFSKGTTRVSTSRTIGDDLILIIDLTQDLPKKFKKKIRSLIKSSKMFQLLSFLGQKQSLVIMVR
jgi:hypothetical protein